MNTEHEKGNISPHKNKVHNVLAHSYIVYFVLFLLGVFLDFIFEIEILPGSILVPTGIFFLILATIIIFWAQRTGEQFRKVAEPKIENFHRGPYRYTRMPTHWGLCFLMLGFGFITDAFFVIVTTLLSFFITKYIFVEKQEHILADKYGESYLEYKKKVKF